MAFSILLIFLINIATAFAEQWEPETIAECYENYRWVGSSWTWRSKDTFYADNTARINNAQYQIRGAYVVEFLNNHTAGKSVEAIPIYPGYNVTLAFNSEFLVRTWPSGLSQNLTCLYPDGKRVVPITPSPGSIDICNRSLAKSITQELKVPYCDSVVASKMKELKRLVVNDEKNKIVTISKSEFAGLENLESLYLLKAQEFFVEDGAFGTLRELTGLAIHAKEEGAKLNLSPGTFDGLANGISLQLKVNASNLKILQSEALRKIRADSLSVDIFSNSEIPNSTFEGLGGFSKIDLNLFHAPAHGVTSKLLEPIASKITALGLLKNGFETIPTAMLLTLPQLKVLQFTSDQLIAVPRESLKGLKIEHLSVVGGMAPFKVFDDSFDEIRGTLKSLYLLKVQSFPAGMLSDMPTLERLSLPGYPGVEKMKLFPYIRASIPTLQSLDISGHSITKLPADYYQEFGAFQPLRNLFLSNNPICKNKSDLARLNAERVHCN